MLLRDVGLVDGAALDGGLEREQDQLRGKRLREDAGRSRLVGLGRQEVRGRVASTDEGLRDGEEKKGGGLS